MSILYFIFAGSKKFIRKNPMSMNQNASSWRSQWREPKKGKNDDSTSFAAYLHVLALFIGSMLNITQKWFAHTRIENRKFEWIFRKPMALLTHSYGAYCEPLHHGATTRDLRSQIFVQQQNRIFLSSHAGTYGKWKRSQSRDVHLENENENFLPNYFCMHLEAVESDVRRDSKNSFRSWVFAFRLAHKIIAHLTRRRDDLRQHLRVL